MRIILSASPITKKGKVGIYQNFGFVDTFSLCRLALSSKRAEQESSMSCVADIEGIKRWADVRKSRGDRLYVFMPERNE